MLQVTLLILALAAPGAPADDDTALPLFAIARGARVELLGSFPERRVQGRLVAIDDDSLTVDTGRALTTVARADIVLARMPTGPRRAPQIARKALTGAAAGAAFGAGMALLLEADCQGNDGSCGVDPAFVARMAGLLAQLGAAGGLLMGAREGRSGWITIPLEGYDLQLRGGAGEAALRVSLRF